MGSHRSPRTTLSVRIDTDVAKRARQFVKDYAGKPLYLKMATFIEQAIEAQIEASTRALEGKERGKRLPSVGNSRL